MLEHHASASEFTQLYRLHQRAWKRLKPRINKSKELKEFISAFFFFFQCAIQERHNFNVLYKLLLKAQNRKVKFNMLSKYGNFVIKSILWPN